MEPENKEIGGGKLPFSGDIFSILRKFGGKSYLQEGIFGEGGQIGPRQHKDFLLEYTDSHGEI